MSKIDSSKLSSKTDSSKVSKTFGAGQRSGGSRIIASFSDLCSEIWRGSPATKSIQAGLETVESLKKSVDEDTDPLECLQRG